MIFYDVEELKAAINAIYGSVEEYAEFKERTKQTMYERIKTQSRGFIKQLEKDGVQLPEPISAKMKDFSIKGDGNQTGGVNQLTNITNESSELKRLKKEIKVLKERLEEKDEIISLQKDKIKTLETQLRK